MREPKDGMPIFMYWHKAKNTPVRYDAAFQKVRNWAAEQHIHSLVLLQCILSYMSDSQL